MADVVVNFNSQWSSIQVAKVIGSPTTAGVADAFPYLRKVEHGLGYPPLAIAMGVANGVNSYSAMVGMDVDSTYVYIDDPINNAYQCVVVYALDISTEYDYTEYASVTGDVVEDTSGGTLDLRNFLLHSRAVSPMLLSVKTKTYTLSDLTFSYTHPLSYPIFNFGYIRSAITSGTLRAGVWLNAPLQSQAFPWLSTNGFTSNLGSTSSSGVLTADKGSIITLRNPAIVTSNSINVSI